MLAYNPQSFVSVKFSFIVCLETHEFLIHLLISVLNIIKGSLDEKLPSYEVLKMLKE